MGSPVDLTLGHHHHHNNHYAAAAAAAAKNVDRKAEEYLRALEDERRKIEGFKRELPLCIQLLEDAIESSIEQLASESNREMPTQPLQLRSLSGEETESNVSTPPPSERPVLEEFMPLKKRWERQEQEEEQEQSGQVTEVQEKCIERPRSSSNGLPAWMAEAQLWTHHQQNPNSQEPSSQARSLRPGDPTVSFGFEEHSSKTHSQLLFSSKKRPAGAFVPFIPERPVATPLSSRSSARTRSAGPDLSLSSGEHPVSSPNGHQFGGTESEVRSIDVSRSTNNLQDNPFTNKGIGMESPTAETTPTLSAGAVGQSQRKARRCWSPELHRRFVSVLHQLGGSQVATPKQIRELMKVDGLTNDEVKSHLQKYRLHTRRPSPCPQPGSSQPPQLVVLGWVPPEYVSGCQPSSVVYNPASGQPSENAQYRQPPMSPDYFNRMKNSPMGTPVQNQQEPLPEAQQAASQTQSSQQAPVQVASQLSSVTQATSSKADQEESGGEEGKSDSATWKGRPSSGDEGMHGDESTEDFKSFSKQKRTVSRIHMPCGTRTHVSSLEVAQKVL